jgi:hypothetical protein
MVRTTGSFHSQDHPDEFSGELNCPSVYMIRGLWFVVCGLWFVVCGLWFVVWTKLWGHVFRVVKNFVPWRLRGK